MPLPTQRVIESETDAPAGVALTVWIRTTKLDEDPDRPAERQVLRGLD